MESPHHCSDSLFIITNDAGIRIEIAEMFSEIAIQQKKGGE